MERSCRSVASFCESRNLLKACAISRSTVVPNRVLLSTDEALPDFVDPSTVVAADILASNGVVHLVDTVILPSDTRRLSEDKKSLRGGELFH